MADFRQLKASAAEYLHPAVNKLHSTGFFHIFLTNILTKTIGLVGNILLARILSKTAYGNYAYILNITAILELLADMGTAGAALQFCSENHRDVDRQRALFSYALRWSMIAELLSCLLIFTARWYYPLKFPEAGHYVALMALLPLLTNANRFLLLNAQIQLENKLYARVNLFTSLTQYFIILPLAYWCDWQGALLSVYAVQTLTMLFALWQSRHILLLKYASAPLERQEKRSFWKFASSSALNYVLNNSLTLIDVFLLGIFIVNLDVIASYKVSITIPTALMFIPSAVDTYALPLFARNRKDLSWVRRGYLRGLVALSGLNLLICTGGILLSKPIMTILYGAKYTDAAQCFSILMFGYFFAAVRALTFTVIYSQRKVNVNVCVTFLCNGLNVLLDIPMIRLWGSRGAAWASTGMNILAAVIMVSYLLLYLRRMERAGQPPLPE